MDPIRTIVVDDHPLFRGGVTRTLAEAGFEVLGEGGSAAEAVDLTALHMPDLILLDISMPGGGIAAAREVGSRFPAVRIVMLTVSEADDDVLSALEAGAHGYVLKGVGSQELVALLRDVHTGGSYVSPSLAARLLAAMQKGQRPSGSSPVADLTRREEEILRLVAKGHSNKEIGRALDLQEKTVKHYMTNILQKLQVRNRVEAAVLARNRGL
jgi:two-component system nitrate/nitrite response regulator NarL